jgi:hypothetical protein
MNFTCVISVQRTVLHDAIAQVNDTKQAHGKGFARDHGQMQRSG